MQRYELVEGTSSKFWEVWTDADTLYVRFGRIGTDGQTKPKKLATPSAAQAEMAKLVAEKTKKGYSLVDGAGTPPPVKKSGNPELEEAIVANPDSPDAWVVYGDWLSEQGDPLGELVAIDAALAKSPDPELAKKREALVSANEKAWLGDFADLVRDGDAELTWRYGFLDAVAMGSDEYCELDAAELYGKLLKLPTSKFLRDLRFKAFDDEDGQPSYAGVIKAIAKLGVPPTLRRLAFDVCDYQVSWTDLGDLSKLYPLLERLEELDLHVGKMKLGTMALPSLRKLTVRTGGFSTANLKSVVGAAWPRLESLVLYFGSDEYGCDCEIEDLRPIFDGKNLDRVTHLGLCNSELEDDIAREITRSKIVARLEQLDLSKGTMTDDGARALLDGALALGHLKKLDVSQNYLSDDMVEKLRAVFGDRLDASEQGEPDEDYRYVQIAE